MDDPREKCDECKHRSVSICPGTQRQIIARYKAAWDACYACARAARHLLTEWASCAVDCKMRNNCKLSCDSVMVSLCRRSLKALGIKRARITRRKEGK